MSKNSRLIINSIKKHLGYETDKDLASFLGIESKALSNQITREGLDLELLYTKCGFIDGNWLMSGGVGDMIKKAAPEMVAAQQEIKKLRSSLDNLQRSLAEAFRSLDQMDKEPFVGREYLESKLTSGRQKPHKP